MHKDPGKAPVKSSRKGHTPSNRTGPRTANGESKSWFSRPTKSLKSNQTKNVQVKSLSASSPALINNNNNNESNNRDTRPLTNTDHSKVTLRRGQQSSKLEAQASEDLSRSSSISNLNVDQKAKGAKPKKIDSKEKLDKILEKKHDKNRALNKNNNKESGESLPDPSVEVEELQKQLAQMANDKANLALQLGEQSGHLSKLQGEIARLKMLQEDSSHKFEQLIEENTLLRNRLRDVAHSPLSDNEKQQLLYESCRHHSSAPASIATNLLEDGGDVTAGPTPEWDKRSSSNVSEVSVACLQDKINQMQETHYSTNEELQATLQELTDLQKQLTELQQENVRLNEEKTLMFESLCRQTERLNDSRNEVESLKQFLYKDESGQFETSAEREQKLVDLLKSAQEERENLLVKQEQLGNELEDSRSTNVQHGGEIVQLSDRVKTLESTLDAKHAEHKLLDQELAQAKDQSSSRQIEINRLKDLLENARTNIHELEQDRALSDKSELDELLDNARKEKDALESEVAHLKEKLALSKNENEKLREQVSILQEECKVIRNNAKMTQSDLEYKVEKLLTEKNSLTEQLQQYQEVVNELQVQSQCQLDDKRQLSAVLSETQRNLNESERRVADLENELAELKKVKQEQEEEWEKFQNDLLTSVRVANDFKTEAQQDLQKLIMENKAGREKIKQLEAQLEKLKGGNGNRKKAAITRRSPEELLMSSLDRRYKETQGLSENQLTPEQKAVRTLKLHYDTDYPRHKPVAHKPKDKLAISKPSLESVISNPKLEKIVNDSQFQNVERPSYFSDEEQKNRKSMSPRRISLIDNIGDSVDDITTNRKSSLPEVLNEELRIEEHTRSRSLSDLPTATIKREEDLQRYDTMENLAVFSKEEKPTRRDTVDFNILDEICTTIDPNVPECELTKEQQLALRLRDALGKEEKKILKKRTIVRDKVVISRPTKESVEGNAKLYRIMNDPVMRRVGDRDVKEKMKIFKKNKERHSVPLASKTQKDSLKNSKKSKSYNDISFKFKVPDMYSGREESKVVDFLAVMPPEEFRDPDKHDPIFPTFNVNSNTFKKEHNYLDEAKSVDWLESETKEIVHSEHTFVKEVEDIEDDSSDSSYVYVEEISDRHAEIEVLDDTDDVDFGRHEDQIEFVVVEGTSETLNDVLWRRLEYENDFVCDDLDEEIREARFGTMQRYSLVVEEMKEKFDSSSDDDEKEDQNLSESKFSTVSEENVEDGQDQRGNVAEDRNLIETASFSDDEVDKIRPERVLVLPVPIIKIDFQEDDSNIIKGEETVTYESVGSGKGNQNLDEMEELKNTQVVKSDVDEDKLKIISESDSDSEEEKSNNLVTETIREDVSGLVFQDESSSDEEQYISAEEHVREDLSGQASNNFVNKIVIKVIGDENCSPDEDIAAKGEDQANVTEETLVSSIEPEGNIGKEYDHLIQNAILRNLLDHESADLSEDGSELNKNDDETCGKDISEWILGGRDKDISNNEAEMATLNLGCVDVKDDVVWRRLCDAYLDETEEHKVEESNRPSMLEAQTSGLEADIQKIEEKISNLQKKKLNNLDVEADVFSAEDKASSVLEEQSKDLAIVATVTKTDVHKPEEKISLLQKKLVEGESNYLDLEADVQKAEDEPSNLQNFLEEKSKRFSATSDLGTDVQRIEEMIRHLQKKKLNSLDLAADVQKTDDKPSNLQEKLVEEKSKHALVMETLTSDLEADVQKPEEKISNLQKKKLIEGDSHCLDLDADVQKTEDKVSNLRDKVLEEERLSYLKIQTSDSEIDVQEPENKTSNLRKKFVEGESNYLDLEADVQKADEKISNLHKLRLLADKPSYLIEADVPKTEHKLRNVEEKLVEEKSNDLQKTENKTNNLQMEKPKLTAQISETDVKKTEDKPSDVGEKFLDEKSNHLSVVGQQTSDFGTDVEMSVEKIFNFGKKKSLEEKSINLPKLQTQMGDLETDVQKTEDKPNLRVGLLEEESSHVPSYLDETNAQKAEENSGSRSNRSSVLLYDSTENPQIEEIRSRYIRVDSFQEPHRFPRILPPTSLNQTYPYEPVYANFSVSSEKGPIRPQSIQGKKPKALPRQSMVEDTQPIYREFGGQVRKTRFSMTYDFKKGDSFKERNQDKSIKVKDLKEMFESKSKSDS